MLRCTVRFGSVLGWLLRAAEMHGDACSWRFRVHRVHYVIAFVARRFALVFVLRASPMHGHVCVRLRVHRRWFWLAYVVGLRVLEDRRV